MEPMKHSKKQKTFVPFFVPHVLDRTMKAFHKKNPGRCLLKVMNRCEHRHSFPQIESGETCKKNATYLRGGKFPESPKISQKYFFESIPLPRVRTSPQLLKERTSELCQFPRTYECAKCAYPTGSVCWMFCSSPMAPESIRAFILRLTYVYLHMGEQTLWSTWEADERRGSNRRVGRMGHAYTLVHELTIGKVPWEHTRYVFAYRKCTPWRYADSNNYYRACTTYISAQSFLCTTREAFCRGLSVLNQFSILDFYVFFCLRSPLLSSFHGDRRYWADF